MKWRPHPEDFGPNPGAAREEELRPHANGLAQDRTHAGAVQADAVEMPVREASSSGLFTGKLPSVRRNHAKAGKKT